MYVIGKMKAVQKTCNPKKYCGVVPSLFGHFSEIPSLYMYVFSNFFVTRFCCCWFFLGGGGGGGGGGE